jgi:hypothetical protein
MPEIVAEYVDRLCTIGMRPQGMSRGTLLPLYDAARTEAGEPLAMKAARLLNERVKPGDTVFNPTGAGVPPWMPYGETDGPLGAVALGRAITLGLRATPIFLGEARNMPPLEATIRAAGLLISPREWITARPGTGVTMTVSFPTDDAEAQQVSRSLIEHWQPSAIIAIEKLGPNAKGEIHSVRGTNWTAEHSKVQHLFSEAAARGIATVGIGDGGNEIGFGRIYEQVRQIDPFARECQCPCGDGMATVVATDVLVVAAISNWGAYGIAACLAFLRGSADVLHDEETETRMLVACAEAGGMDGMTSLTIPMVDGTTERAQRAVIGLLREIVGNNLREFVRPY